MGCQPAGGDSRGCGADGAVPAVGVAIGVALGARMHNVGAGIATGIGIAGVLIALQRCGRQR